MSRDEAAEALLIEVSRWQRAEADRLGIPLQFRDKPVPPVSRGIGPHIERNAK